jgi:hypothetical protein
MVKKFPTALMYGLTGVCQSTSFRGPQLVSGTGFLTFKKGVILVNPRSIQANAALNSSHNLLLPSFITELLGKL